MRVKEWVKGATIGDAHAGSVNVAKYCLDNGRDPKQLYSIEAQHLCENLSKIDKVIQFHTDLDSSKTMGRFLFPETSWKSYTNKHIVILEEVEPDVFIVGWGYDGTSIGFAEVTRRV